MTRAHPAAVSSHPTWLLPVALVITGLSAVVPLGLYWAAVGRAPSLTADQARQRLATDTAAVLIDLRTPAEQAALPLPAARTARLSSLLALSAGEQLPTELQGRELLLMCSGGVQGAQAARHLVRLGVPAYVVAGGVQAWVASSGTEAQDFRRLPRWEQAWLVFSVYPVKAVYMALALLGLLWLWPAGSLALQALRGSLAFFLAGEAACWANIVFFPVESVALEFAHSWAMVGCLGFLAFAGFEALDAGLVRYSNPRGRCALAGLCSRCAKQSAGACLVVRLLAWTLPLLAALNFMLLSAPLRPVSYNTLVFGQLRNFTHPILIQLYELRVGPLAALGLLAAAWGVLLAWRGERARRLLLAKALAAAGLAPLIFGFMRLALLAFYESDLVWFFAWEELTELMLIASVLVVLRLVSSAGTRVPVPAG
jgi:rhodanese-related sulfurtransferase